MGRPGRCRRLAGSLRAIQCRQPAYGLRTAIRPASRLRARQANPCFRGEETGGSDEHHVATARPASGGGVASFYTEDSQTASGEKYDPTELTAAHPTLPFGTRLRVTNTTTGKSVTVRVNDRGPYVPGRVVDVSYSAAQALGMVHSGTANVKLDVMQ